MERPTPKQQAYLDASRELGRLNAELKAARGLKKLAIIRKINAHIDKIAAMDDEQPAQPQDNPTLH